MKSLQIGKDLTVKLAENLNEIKIKRWVAIQQHILTSQTNSDISDIKKFWVEFCQEFDKESKSGMFIKAHDWLYNLSTLERGDNPDQFVFALITFLEGEDETRYERDFILEKLEKYSKAGLDQGTVKREVENFIAGVLSF